MSRTVNNNTYFRVSWNINKNIPIEIEESETDLHGKPIPIVQLTITFTDGREEVIPLGAHIIKESMAAMYQSLIDENEYD